MGLSNASDTRQRELLETSRCRIHGQYAIYGFLSLATACRPFTVFFVLSRLIDKSSVNRRLAAAVSIKLLDNGSRLTVNILLALRLSPTFRDEREVALPDLGINLRGGVVEWSLCSTAHKRIRSQRALTCRKFLIPTKKVGNFSV